jgi:hypothetical protein
MIYVVAVVFFEKERNVTGIYHAAVFHVHEFVPAFHENGFVQVRKSAECPQSSFYLHVFG